MLYHVQARAESLGNRKRADYQFNVGQEILINQLKHAQKLSAQNDVQDLINEMGTASCGLQCLTAKVHHYVIN